LNEDDIDDIVGSCVAHCVRHFVRLQQDSLVKSYIRKTSFVHTLFYDFMADTFVVYDLQDAQFYSIA